jgi:hypothetical protein
MYNRTTTTCFNPLIGPSLVMNICLRCALDCRYCVYTEWHKKRELLKCIVATMYSWQHCGTGTLSYRRPRHSVIMDQWNGQQRVSPYFFLDFYNFCWIGFSKVPVFLCHPVLDYEYTLVLYSHHWHCTTGMTHLKILLPFSTFCQFSIAL